MPDRVDPRVEPEAREGDERVDPRFDEAWMERVRTEAQRHQAEWDTYDTDAAK